MRVLDNDREIDGNIYLRLQQESSPLKEARDEYESMLTQLRGSEAFTYYEIYGQPLTVEENFFGELSDSVPCVQISKNVTNDFGLEVVSGRTFGNTDFLYDGTGSIPVILGNTYNGKIDPGTQFEGEYLYDTYQFTVIGILGENSRIDLGFKSYLLDESVIMPSFELSDTANFTDGMKIHYANKTSGAAKASSEMRNDIPDCINEIVNSSQSGRYSWYTSSARINFRQMVGIDAINLAVMSITGILLTAGVYLFLICKKMKSVRFVWKITGTDILCQAVIYLALTTVLLPVLNSVTYLIGFRLHYFVTIFSVLVILLVIDLLAYFIQIIARP